MKGDGIVKGNGVVKGNGTMKGNGIMKGKVKDSNVVVKGKLGKHRCCREDKGQVQCPMGALDRESI